MTYTLFSVDQLTRLLYRSLAQREIQKN